MVWHATPIGDEGCCRRDTRNRFPKHKIRSEKCPPQFVNELSDVKYQLMPPPGARSTLPAFSRNSASEMPTSLCVFILATARRRFSTCRGKRSSSMPGLSLSVTISFAFETSCVPGSGCLILVGIGFGERGEKAVLAIRRLYVAAIGRRYVACPPR